MRTPTLGERHGPPPGVAWPGRVPRRATLRGAVVLHDVVVLRGTTTQHYTHHPIAQARARACAPARRRGIRVLVRRLARAAASSS